MARSQRCPCGSGRRAGSCCAPDGRVRPRPAGLRFEVPSTPQFIAGCYAACLQSCHGTISDEHFISENLLRKQSSSGVLTVTGPAWPEGRRIPIPRISSRVLCEGHNHAIDPLDASMGRFVDRVIQAGLEVAEKKPEPWLFAIHGYDLERWLLKLLCGMVAGGHAATAERKRYAREVPDRWVRILFGVEAMPPSWGLYVDGEVGAALPLGERTIQVVPLSANGELVGVRAALFGWTLTLSMTFTAPHKSTGAITPTSIYRPSALIIPSPAGEKRIHIHWEAGDRQPIGVWAVMT